MSKPKSTRTKRSTTLTPYNVTWAALSDRERNLLHYLSTRQSADLAAMTRDVFGNGEAGTSPARNTVRRPFNCQLIARVDRGTYALTPSGRSLIPLSLHEPMPAALMERAPLMTLKERLEHELERQRPVLVESAVADLLAAALRLAEAAQISQAPQPERETAAPVAERRKSSRERRSN